ncbi:uncharacterized protein [Malus domestica]|uniref:uncharacterized protein n=1 Tax=Malus domestica TaxID=3750 RepID=UPI0039755053
MVLNDVDPNSMEDVKMGGRANIVADAFSRKTPVRINAWYACYVHLLVDLKSTGVKLGIENREEALLISKLDPFGRSYSRLKRLTKKFKNLFNARNNGKKKDLRVRESDGKLMQENKVFIPNVMELKKPVMDEAYGAAYARRHEGIKTYLIIRTFYYLPSMKREMAKYVSKRIISHQVKAERNKSFGIM